MGTRLVGRIAMVVEMMVTGRSTGVAISVVTMAPGWARGMAATMSASSRVTACNSSPMLP